MPTIVTKRMGKMIQTVESDSGWVILLFVGLMDGILLDTLKDGDWVNTGKGLDVMELEGLDDMGLEVDSIFVGADVVGIEVGMIELGEVELGDWDGSTVLGIIDGVLVEGEDIVG